MTTYSISLPLWTHAALARKGAAVVLCHCYISKLPKMKTSGQIFSLGSGSRFAFFIYFFILMLRRILCRHFVAMETLMCCPLVSASMN